MKQLDEIIYDAIKADEDIMAMIAYDTPDGGKGYAIKDVCFEIPPDEMDNTPLPNIIVTDDGFQNQQGTKDCVWEAPEDSVQVTVDIAANSPKEVNTLVHMVRRAIESHVVAMYSADPQSAPTLQSLTSDGILWDWMKPCYFQKFSYQCIIKACTNDE